MPLIQILKDLYIETSAILNDLTFNANFNTASGKSKLAWMTLFWIGYMYYIIFSLDRLVLCSAVVFFVQA